MATPNLSSLSVNELRSLAKAAHVTNAARLRKHELIEALQTLPELPAGAAAQPPAHVPAADALPAAPAPAGSSAASAPAAPVFGPDGDPGLPIPDRYGIDRAVLMVQDPHHIFLWWELTGGVLEQARALLTEPGSGVLLIHGPDGVEQRLVDLVAGNHYLSVRPGAAYHIEVALRAADGRLVVLITSNAVSTPADAPSPRLDVAWMSVDETFSALLDRAGLDDGQQPSSAERYRIARLQQRLWEEWTPTHDSSLGLQVRPAPLPPEGPGLSSLALSSRSLSSSSLGSHTLAWQR